MLAGPTSVWDSEGLRLWRVVSLWRVAISAFLCCGSLSSIVIHTSCKACLPPQPALLEDAWACSRPT